MTCEGQRFFFLVRIWHYTRAKKKKKVGYAKYDFGDVVGAQLQHRLPLGCQPAGLSPAARDRRQRVAQVETRNVVGRVLSSPDLLPPVPVIILHTQLVP